MGAGGWSHTPAPSQESYRCWTTIDSPKAAPMCRRLLTTWSIRCSIDLDQMVNARRDAAAVLRSPRHPRNHQADHVREAILQDVAVVSGGQVISEDIGLKLENATAADLAASSVSSSTRITPLWWTVRARKGKSRGASRN